MRSWVHADGCREGPRRNKKTQLSTFLDFLIQSGCSRNAQAQTLLHGAHFNDSLVDHWTARLFGARMSCVYLFLKHSMLLNVSRCH